MSHADTNQSAEQPSPRTRVVSANSSNAISIGTGTVRSAAASKIFPSKTHCVSLSIPLGPSSTESVEYRSSPNGAKGHTIRGVTRITLSAATTVDVRSKKASDSRTPTPQQSTSVSTEAPNRKKSIEVDLTRRLHVDDKGWTLASKQGSSPKVATQSTGDKTPAVTGSRTAIITKLTNAANLIDGEKRTNGLDSSQPKKEPPQLARGRVLGGTAKESGPLVGVQERQERQEQQKNDGIAMSTPLKDTIPSQVEGPHHYQPMSRCLGAHEYASGLTPQSGGAIHSHGRSKDAPYHELSKSDEDMARAYSTLGAAQCGAEFEGPQKPSTPKAPTIPPKPLSKPPKEPRVIERISKPPNCARKETTGLCQLNGISLPERPAQLINRKPVGSSPTPLTACVTTSASPLSTSKTIVAPQAPSTSSPAKASPFDHSSQRLTYARSSSSSPPKKKNITPHRPHLSPDARGLSLPCTFPMPQRLEPDADDPFPPSPTPLPTLRPHDRPILLRLDTAGSVAKNVRSVLEENGEVKSVIDAGQGGENEPQGAEKVPMTPIFDAITSWELHPWFGLVLSKLADNKHLVLWVCKLLLLCYLAASLWSVLDAMRSAMVKILWPLWVLLGVGRWLAGN